MDLDTETLSDPIGFTECALGLSLYGWQDKTLAPLALSTGHAARRINIACAAPNGAGKDERIIAGAAYWWIANHKRGRVAITTKSDLQLSQQTIPQLERHRTKFEGYEKVETPRYQLTTPTGGKIVAYVTKDANRVEGWHKEDDIDGPLLLIVNEAKSVDDAIFTGLDRCTPNAVLWVSSTGLKRGRFYKAFTEHASQWVRVKAGLLDCPHIPKERIDYILATWGPDHPVTKSTLYAEFMDQEEMDKFVVNFSSLESLLQNPVTHVPGIQAVFCDFADGGAENVIAYRDGNKIEIFDAWKEPNKFASLARFITGFKKLERKWRGAGPFESVIWGDAADKEMCDLLEEAGWKIRRQNFGAPANNPEIYLSWGAEAWRELSVGIEKRDWILPNDDKFIEQVTTRLRTFGRAGKLGVEDKHALKKRNLVSPDRGDAVAGVANVRDWGQSEMGRINRQGRLDRRLEESADSRFLQGIGADAGW